VNPEVPDTLVAYFARFKISDDTLFALGVYRTDWRMPVIDKEGVEVKDTFKTRPVIAYPYVDDGELVNVKYKAVYPRGDKTVKRFRQELDTRRSLYNIDSFRTEDMGLVVEGEDDVLAAYECGYHQSTTLPDGSPTKLKPEADFDRLTDDDHRYEALYGEPRLDRLKRVYLAGDMDPAGQRHMEEVARRIGKGRCWQVRWPAGCKDCKETLTKRGAEAVQHAIDNALPYPIEGEYQVTEEAIANLHAGIAETRLLTGYPALDDRFCLSDEGLLLVTTGISGRGKTTFWNAVAMMLAEHNEEEMKVNRLVRPFHAIICSAELRPEVIMARMIAQHANLSFPSMPLDQVMQVMAWVRRHFSFIRWPDRSTMPTVSWLKGRICELTKRTGAKLVIVDPWQEFDDEMPDREYNHSRWLGKVIQGFVGITYELRINIVLVVHPTKLKRDKEGKMLVPEGDDIADTIHFASRCDTGITVHRPDVQSSEMLIRVWKARYGRFARYGDTTMRYDPVTCRLWPKLMEAQPTGNAWAEDRS
jgi:twinkle protein